MVNFSSRQLNSRLRNTAELSATALVSDRPERKYGTNFMPEWGRLQMKFPGTVY